ncbi:antiviral RADAR system adenosine deaminase RdrB [Pseudomonas sp. NPDC087346]|uniref:antiviral RADAR system adenosine deaminase RdrB n=1 Tax=Pseudomonas sp. NPDC087346 TaxID=3364438 RepID=UPI00380E2659
MLDQSLFELASATCFSSTSLAETLRARLLSAPNLGDPTRHDSFHETCLRNLRKDLDADYPRRFRINDMDLALETLWPRNLFLESQGGRLDMLDGLFDQLFLENGDVIQYRDDRVQAYVRSAARLDPALLAGWRIAKRLREQPRLGCNDLSRIVEAQQPFFSPRAQTDKAFAENHVHLGGVHYDGLVLMSGLSTPLKELANEPALKVLPSLQRLTQRLLMDIGTTPLENKDVRKICIETLGSRWKIEPPVAINWRWLAEKQMEPADVLHPHWQRQKIARALVKGDTGKAWLWFVIWCWTRYQDPACSSELRMALFYLLNSLTHMRRQLLMDGQGLTRFVDVYNNHARRNLGWDQQYTDAARRIFHGDGDVAEIKVVHHQFTPQAVVQWLGHLANAIGLDSAPKLQPVPLAKQLAMRNAFERWHFCIHLIRDEFSRDNPSNVWLEANKLESKLNSNASWEREELINTSTLWPGRLQPARWIRGLDVAGDENAVKTEVFAPALRWLRQGLQCKPFLAAPSSGLHLSVHAGEDYAHPLSGMRHIDETVVFCEMRAGDRLGHALAIGVEPKMWLERHGEAVLPLDEHVDNLVWAWHHACEMSPHLDLAAQIVPKLERTLRRLIPYLSWLCEGQVPPTIEQLFDAWRMRRNCYHYVTRNIIAPFEDAKFNIAVPDRREFERHSKEHPSPAVALYKQRWRVLSSRRSGLNEYIWAPQDQQRQVVCKVRIRQSDHESDSHYRTKCDLNLITVTETSNEVVFMHALQDWLLDRYDRLGLIIEANPTSNVYIARLKCHSEHPVFRWYPPDESTLHKGAKHNLFGLRRGPIKFCVNTDDPGIMPTTLRTEFSLLREAAQAHEVSRTQAEQWLERIRLLGLEQFNQKHESLWG